MFRGHLLAPDAQVRHEFVERDAPGTSDFGESGDAIDFRSLGLIGESMKLREFVLSQSSLVTLGHELAVAMVQIFWQSSVDPQEQFGL